MAMLIVAPLATWCATALAAHPVLVTLVPLSFERFGALAFVAVSVWLALGEIIGKHPPSSGYWAGLRFAIVAIIASTVGFDPISGIVSSIVLGAICLSGSAIYRLARDGAWAPLYAVWLWSGLSYCAIALIAFVLRKPAALYAFSHGRAVGIFENPNELALFALAVCASAGAALIGGLPMRRLAWVTLAVGLGALLATGSRSGELSLGIGIVALALMLRPRRATVYIGSVLVIILGLAFAYGFEWRHNPAENDTRRAAWIAGAKTVALYPLTGVGLGSFYRVYPFVRTPYAPGPEDPIAFDPHNFYLSVAAETGLVGLGAFLWTMVAFARELRVIYPGASPAARRCAFTLLAGLVAMAFHLIFNGFILSIILWSIMAAFTMGIQRSRFGHAS
jgi:hypothetical protein